MKIVFIGAVEFSRRALECLTDMQADIAGVCTLEQSTFNADHCDLSNICEAHGIPWIYAPNINAEEPVKWLMDIRPDVIFCFGWSKLLQKEILNLAPLGVVGFHPAALPANRGRHPIIWALVLGLEETASTFFFMDEGADRGDILSQKKVIIEEGDDAAILYEKITRCAMNQINEFVPQLVSGVFPKVAQNNLQASTWRKRGKADGQIDWRMTARSILNLVRGLNKPYVGAHFIYQGQEIKVWKAEIVLEVPRNIEPGKILGSSADGVVVKCGEQAICLVKTDPQFNAEQGEYL